MSTQLLRGYVNTSPNPYNALTPTGRRCRRHTQQFNDEAEQGPKTSLVKVTAATTRRQAEPSPLPGFVPVQVQSNTPSADIRIELTRGVTAVSIHWPVGAAAECAAWMRELVR